MITVLHRGGYAKMITILHRGAGVSRDPKKDYVICARALIWIFVFFLYFTFNFLSILDLIRLLILLSNCLVGINQTDQESVARLQTSWQAKWVDGLFCPTHDKKHMTNKQKRKHKHKQEKTQRHPSKNTNTQKNKVSDTEAFKKTLSLTFVMKKEWFTKYKPWRRHIVPARFWLSLQVQVHPTRPQGQWYWFVFNLIWHFQVSRIHS